MRKLFALAVAGAMLAAPAIAQTMTVEFAAEGADGVLVVTLSGDGTYTASDGTAGTYTWDEATQTLCGTNTECEVCATFDG